ncbi:hypothetical protein [Giesbergeria anulus]|nr:hypothetical protein [Giesbergeria anulus]
MLSYNAHEAQRYDIYGAIAQLEAATTNYNNKFDETNHIFLDVEKSLQKFNIEYWHPQFLSPRFPVERGAMPLYSPPQPYSIVAYQLGYCSGRLMIRKIVSDYDYERDAWGNVVYYWPNNFPCARKIKDDVENPIPVSDSAREIRVMAIENLPWFIDSIRSYVEVHTQTLNFALDSIRNR